MNTNKTRTKQNKQREEVLFVVESRHRTESNTKESNGVWCNVVVGVCSNNHSTECHCACLLPRSLCLIVCCCCFQSCKQILFLLVVLLLVFARCAETRTEDKAKRKRNKRNGVPKEGRKERRAAAAEAAPQGSARHGCTNLRESRLSCLRCSTAWCTMLCCGAWGSIESEEASHLPLTQRPAEALARIRAELTTLCHDALPIALPTLPSDQSLLLGHGRTLLNNNNNNNTPTSTRSDWSL